MELSKIHQSSSLFSCYLCDKFTQYNTKFLNVQQTKGESKVRKQVVPTRKTVISFFIENIAWLSSQRTPGERH